MRDNYFNEDVRKLSEEDPLRTLNIFLKYNFPIKDGNLEEIVKNAERIDLFKTHKILIEYGKEKLDKKTFNKLLDYVEKNSDSSATQMLVLFEIGKQYIEENPGIDFKNSSEIQRLIKLSPISLNFLNLKPEINFAICQSLKDTNDTKLAAALLKSNCLYDKGFKQIRQDLITSFKRHASKEDYELVRGVSDFKSFGKSYDAFSR